MTLCLVNRFRASFNLRKRDVPHKSVSNMDCRWYMKSRKIYRASTYATKFWIERQLRGNREFRNSTSIDSQNLYLKGEQFRLRHPTTSTNVTDLNLSTSFVRNHAHGYSKWRCSSDNSSSKWWYSGNWKHDLRELERAWWQNCSIQGFRELISFK